MSEDQNVDLDAPFDPEQIAREAQANASVADLLRKAKLRVAKIPIFTDLEMVDTFATLSQQAQAANDLAAQVDMSTPEGVERNRLLVEEYNRLEQEVEEARAQMLSVTLSFHLRAHPNMAVKVARRDAKKIFINPETGQLFEHFDQQDVNDFIDNRLLGACIQKVVNAQGERVDFGVPRADFGEFLSEELPPSQWDRLHAAYQRLTLTDRVAEAATFNPGF